MSKKGFTLVELLAVIVILAVVMLIGSVSISAVKSNIDKNMFKTKLDMVINAAKTYGQDRMEQFRDPDSGDKVNDSIRVKVGKLIELNYIETDETVEKTMVPGCTKEIAATPESPAKCYVVSNPVTDTFINELTLVVYLKSNRVYACIPLNNDNKIVLNEPDACVKTGCVGDDCTYSSDCQYSETNYYCSKFD